MTFECRCFAFYKKKTTYTRKSVSSIGDSDPEVLSFGLFIEVFNTLIHPPFPAESRDAGRCWVLAAAFGNACTRKWLASRERECVKYENREIKFQLGTLCGC